MLSWWQSALSQVSLSGLPVLQNPLFFNCGKWADDSIVRLTEAVTVSPCQEQLIYARGSTFISEFENKLREKISQMAGLGGYVYFLGDGFFPDADAHRAAC
jgi:hypothetical protein